MRSNALALTNTKNKSGKRAGAVYDAHGRRSCFQNRARRLRKSLLLYSNVLCSSAVAYSQRGACMLCLDGDLRNDRMSV